MASSIDLRSDLLSRPSSAVLAAMQSAAADAPGFGLREDPWVKRLEATTAELLGKEDALFCPTCTMCNQLAINVQSSPGETVVTGASSHVVTSEGGAPAALSGVMIHGISDSSGHPTAAEVRDAFALQVSDGRPRSVLLALENTHTRSGGTVMDVPTMRTMRAIAVDAGARVHLDGARLFNAAEYLGCDVADLANFADSVAISLNKGLGAPVGAVLAGSRDLIARASAMRQRLGGAWRPVGVLAAAGLAALTRRDHLQQDHARALRFAKDVAGTPGLQVVNTPVQTNLVLVAPNTGAPACDDLLQQLSSQGILALAFDGRLRFAFHNGIDDHGVARAAAAVRTLTLPGTK